MLPTSGHSGGGGGSGGGYVGGGGYGTGRGGGARGGGGGGGSPPVMQIADDEDEEEALAAMRMIEKLSAVRALQRSNKLNGIGDSDGIDATVQRMYEEIKREGKLTYDNTVAGDQIQLGVSEEGMKRLPSRVVDAEFAAEQGGIANCVCTLCLEACTVGDMVGVLPCNHFFHHSPPLPSHDKLPKELVIGGKRCRLVQWGQLRYKEDRWLCTICDRPQVPACALVLS